MRIGNFAGAVLGIKLINGKIRPKYDARGVAATIFIVLLLIAMICAFIYGILNGKTEFIIRMPIGMFALGYILLINPYLQKSRNFYIEFQNENSLSGFKLYYKGKLVNIKYKIDNCGKFAFANNSRKLGCISYADGTKMPNLIKYRVMNYFTKWLSGNNLLSDEVTSTFEEL